MAIVYRTTGAWGAGKGAKVAHAEMDNNLWDAEQHKTAPVATHGVWAGRVTDAGVWDVARTDGFTVSKTGTGVYLITHALNAEVAVIVQPAPPGNTDVAASVRFADMTVNAFTVRITYGDNDDSSNPVDCAFLFIMYRL